MPKCTPGRRLDRPGRTARVGLPGAPAGGQTRCGDEHQAQDEKPARTPRDRPSADRWRLWMRSCSAGTARASRLRAQPVRTSHCPCRRNRWPPLGQSALGLPERCAVGDPASMAGGTVAVAGTGDAGGMTAVVATDVAAGAGRRGRCSGHRARPEAVLSPADRQGRGIGRRRRVCRRGRRSSAAAPAWSGLYCRHQRPAGTPKPRRPGPRPQDPRRPCRGRPPAFGRAGRTASFRPCGRRSRAASASVRLKSRGRGGVGRATVAAAMAPRSAKKSAHSEHAGHQTRWRRSRSRSSTSPP